MQSAKEAISKFTSRSGHTTEVDETVSRPVTSEVVKPTRHENITEAVDRETHQHHHHTTVQPLQHQEVLPEKHSHNMVPVEEREFHHGNDDETRLRLERERAKFQDTSRTHETRQTQATLPTAAGEHVHHHVHETVQPVIHKETVQPEVVHTTVPVHETHHADAQHHGTSVLPMKNLSEFGGVGQGTRHEEYSGVPRTYNKAMQQTQTESDMNPMNTGVDGPGSHHTGGTGLAGSEPFRDDAHRTGGTGMGTGSSGLRNAENDLRTGERGMGHTGGTGMGTGSSGLRNAENDLRTGERDMGHTGGTGMGTGSSGLRNAENDIRTGERDMGTGKSATGTGDRGYGNSGLDNTSSTNTKPSLMDKLNPKVDSNGDGKAGFMK